MNHAAENVAKSQALLEGKRLAPLYQQLAILVDAYHRCATNDATGHEWARKHRAHIEALVLRHMPTGAGFDLGTQIDLDKSAGERLVFTTSYHHMDEHGSYSGWTNHTITVTPSLAHGFILRVGGRDRNGLKEVIHEVFAGGLRDEVPTGP